MKSEGRPVVIKQLAMVLEGTYPLYNFTDPTRPVSPYTSMPVIGMGEEPIWFIRNVEAKMRLRELELEQKIERLKHGRRQPDGVVTRVRTALRLA